jgi:hypothetical protein
MAGGTRFYKIGRLNLPSDGHQAVITINLCYGFNVNAIGLNNAAYLIQNYEMKVHLYSSTTSHSRSVDPFHWELIPLDISNTDYSIFHNGFVVVTSPFVSPLGVYLASVPSDPQNNVDIWIRSYMFHGYPLIQVSQTAGSFTPTTNVINGSMPLQGYIKLDMYSNTLTQIYQNPNNPYWQ